MCPLRSVTYVGSSYSGFSQAGPCVQPKLPYFDPYLNQQYWVQKINLDDVWNQYGSLELPLATVAVIAL
jgi:hypothetical protein